ncbi:acyl-CoA dehydrogenase family protein [Oceanicola sp. 22II-s10i]|uniref:acyl-CoA dehydrogenase family protein n=1 Tax=Oceanicola sp. 22II-s10i TaxID=1317116 RepID=UPI000B528E2B|nr:acyl-CoA dehydrogenase family protein [Oceanicola sp. 22II-s10i]
MTPTALADRPQSSNVGPDARKWLDANLPDALREDVLQQTPRTLADMRAWEAQLHKAGLVGSTWPEAYGGRGLGLRAHLDISREIGRTPMPESVNSIGKELAGPIIMAVGREEQKLEYLPAILEMRNIWCQGFSEPGAGSDLAGLRTRVEKTADGWVVNGQKIWTSGASKADRILLLARTGTVEDRHKGLVLFAVRTDTPGVDIREIRSIDGERHFCEVFFNNAVVPEEDMLGSPDEGWAAATRVLSIERATNRMHRAWRFENQLQHLVSACAANPATRELVERDYAAQLADVSVNIDLLKGHVETLVGSLIEGEEIGPRGSLPKLFWSEAHQSFAALALEIVSRFPPDMSDPLRAVKLRMEEIYLKARAETIYAGTTEIQLGIIAKRILKLNRKA